MEARLLLVSSPHRRSELLRLLDVKDLQIFLASDFGEARHQLGGPSSFDLVLVDAELTDGSWRDILELILNAKSQSQMIVFARWADEELWAEVLHYGAYDLLVEPFDRQEVNHMIRSTIDNRYVRVFAQAGAS